MNEYGIRLVPFAKVDGADCLIVAVAHSEFRSLSLDAIKGLFRDMPDENKVLIDVKGIFPTEALKASGITWWRL